jgi:AcrR family transcriptional regulator
MSEVRRERADAARNRRAILLATEELLATLPPEQISMERVAAAAGVGKGTVFHRFGSRSGLMLALMQERALALHESVLSGPPPLGPGAPPAVRLLAFLDGVVEVVARNKGLLAAVEHAETLTHAPNEPSPVYAFWHGHVAELLGLARSELDAELLAHLLLAPLRADPVQQLLIDGAADRVAAGLRAMAAAMLNAPAVAPVASGG